MNGAPHIVPAQISPEFSARVLYDVPMSKHTSWHAGGPATGGPTGMAASCDARTPSWPASAYRLWASR